MSTRARALSQYSDEEVRALYAEHDNNATKAAAKVGCGPATFRQRMALLSDESYISNKEKATALAFLSEELEARGIDPRAVIIKKAKITTNKKRWEAMHGAGNITPLKGDTRNVVIEFSPRFEEGPAWPLIQPAPQADIKYVAGIPRSAPDVKRTFLWPDTQVGYYRNLDTGKLNPFHDLPAINIALQMLADFHADEVVVMGDLLDLPAMSRYLQLEEFAFTTQPAINFCYQLLARIRSIIGPKAKIVFIFGNHERRMNEYVLTNARAAYNLKPGYAPPDSWPVNSVPYLLGFDQLKIETTAEYPGGEYWISKPGKGQVGGLVAVHAPENSVGKKLRASVVHGHHPQANVKTTTVHYHDGPKEYSVTSIPGLMRTGNVERDKRQLSQSAVASNSVNMNWQQGVGTVLTYPDGYFDVRVHRIFKGTGVMGEKRYYSSK